MDEQEACPGSTVCHALLHEVSVVRSRDGFVTSEPVRRGTAHRHQMTLGRRAG